jgi:hypothetical protein
MIPQLIVAVALAAMCGFFSLLLYRLSEAVRNYRPPVGSMRRRVPSAAVEPQSLEQLKEEVEKLKPVECKQCGTPVMPDSKMCSVCGYAPPINFRTARVGWPSQKRQLESQENPPTLPRKQRSL